MLKMMIMTLSTTLNINFMKINHPMSLMMIIIIQTLLIGMMIGNLMESFWLSYILFITFIGGMLVLFIYITSIASNELFNISMNNLTTNLKLGMLTFLIIIFLEITMLTDIFKNSDTKLFKKTIFIQEMTLSLFKLFNTPTFMITIMMMVYLFLTLLVVIKITNVNQGPMRKMI